MTRIIQSTGHNTSASSFNRFSPTGQKLHQFYASSAPNSSAALQPQNHPTRPPVPLWTSNSTGNVPQSQKISNQHRRVMSTPGIIPSDMDHLFDFGPLGDMSSTDAPLFDSDFSNHFAPVNEPVSGQGPTTVSPKDLMREADSAPPSTAFSHLSTPMSGFENSPQISSYQTSPMDDYLPYDDQPYHGSLFPDADVGTSPIFDPKSFATNTAYTAAPSMTRNKSSPGQSPGTAHGRHSSVSGVNSRRSGKPLGPVVCDKADPTSVKRARNTEAARKSRARKLEKVENLEETIEGLRAELQQNAAEREQIVAERDHYRRIVEGYAN